MIADASEGDCERFAAIHARCFVDAWDADAMRKLLAQPGVIARVSADGFILARVAADEAEILTLAVALERRRSGQGAALVRAAAAAVREAGARRLFLEVSAENAAARGLYAGLGFVEVGRRARYYGDGADALVLELPLT